MYKEVLEQQLETLTSMRDDLIKAQEAARGNVSFKTGLPLPADENMQPILAIAAEIRQTAEALARCQYHAYKRNLTNGGMKK